MRYTIAIEPGDENHTFGVIVPDLPGCYSAGDTLETLPTLPDWARENAATASPGTPSDTFRVCHPEPEPCIPVRA